MNQNSGLPWWAKTLPALTFWLVVCFLVFFVIWSIAHADSVLKLWVNHGNG
jgi:hypothetical protein